MSASAAERFARDAYTMTATPAIVDGLQYRVPSIFVRDSKLHDYLAEKEPSITKERVDYTLFEVKSD